MRDKQIEDEIKQEMLALQQRMDRLAAWRETNFADPCVEHQWVVEHITPNDSPPPNGKLQVRYKRYNIKAKCYACGMEKEEEVEVMTQTLYDPWLEFRPNGNDQVEDEEQ
tara:strand:- start:664 stop:993 length:330 start_codon:yes stop_codon:yes gene_type:complete